MSPDVEHQTTVDSFLKTVLRSGLLERDQLQAALRGVPKDRRNDAPFLADHLVKKGKLSRFQAQKLLKGTALGLLLGPFEVVSPIGKGGMGTVYLARDTRNREMLALKVLPPRRAREEGRLLARFQREMELCQRVCHPHLARTREVGVHRNVNYIAMEYIPGKSLYRLVHAEGPLTVQRAARLFAEAASALEHAHGQGLIHRDLKPSNIMVTPNDHAKVLDLGLALAADETPGPREVVGGQGYVVGSMDYIAPEQTEDASHVDPRADIYGLGCTLYFALTGRPPCPPGTSKEKMRWHRTEEPTPLTQLNPAVAPAFAALVRKMMAKVPAHRYPTAAAVREALLPWAADEPVLPLDQQNDHAFRQAVAELEEADVASDFLGEAILVVDEAPRSGLRGILGQWADKLGYGANDYLWICMGVIGFWFLLLALLGIVLLVR